MTHLFELARNKCYRTWNVFEGKRRIGSTQENKPSSGVNAQTDDGRRWAWSMDDHRPLGVFDNEAAALSAIKEVS